MTEELTMTPFRATALLRRFKHDEKMLGPDQQAAIDFAISAITTLTQRPAAQTEREAFEAWFDDYYDKACAEFGGIDCTDPKGIAEDAWQARASVPAPQQATPAQPSHTLICGKCKVDRFKAPCPNLSNCGMGFVAQGDNLLMKQAEREALSPSALSLLQSCAASATQQATPSRFGSPDLQALIVQHATQQATPEPVTLGPLAKRNIYDAIRGAYDLGYNDARNARTVPGDSAPGYDGRSVEEDHGGALFNTLSKRLTPGTPEPVGKPVGTVECYQIRGEDVVLGYLPRPLPVGTKLYTRPAPGVPETDADALLDFMEAHRVSVTPEYEGQWCARQYDDEPQAVAEFEAATPRDAIRALAAAQAKGGE